MSVRTSDLILIAALAPVVSARAAGITHYERHEPAAPDVYELVASHRDQGVIRPRPGLLAGEADVLYADATGAAVGDHRWAPGAKFTIRATRTLMFLLASLTPLGG